MDSNSPLGWYEAKTPLYLLEEQGQRQVFETEIDKYIQAANNISDNQAGYLTNAIKNAWFDENKDKNKVQKNPSIMIKLPKLQNVSGTTLKVNSMN